METTHLRAPIALAVALALAGCSSTVKRPDGGEGLLPVGSSAPDFAATTKAGDPTRLSALHGAPVVVYFYPKDETPGCTTEACSFRDAWEKLAKSGVVMVGVSTDSDASHNGFVSHHKLPFHLVSDPDGKLAKLFGVPMNGTFMARQTIVIGPDGNVKKIYRTVDVTKHAAEISADLGV